MTTALQLGMPLDAVVAAATMNPARTMNFPEKVGTLEPGTTADVSVINLEQGSFEFEAHMNGAEMVAVVRDFGRWRPARGQNRGRGLELVHRMMDSAEVVPHERGTEVRLRRRLNAGSAR